MKTQFNMTDVGIRRDKAWWCLETPHYLLMFDQVARTTISPERFGIAAEKRVTVIASLLHLPRNKKTKRFPLGRRIPYFVHDPTVCRYGNVDVGGIDVPAGRPWAFYQHEEAHAVLGSLVESVPSVFNEGFATFAQSPKSRQNDRITLAGLDHRALADLSSILEFWPFWKTWKVRGGFMYQQAGSFVGFIVQRFGAERFLRFCRSCAEDDSRAAILRAFQDAYDEELRTVEERWKEFLIRNRRKLNLRALPKVGGSTERNWVERSLSHIAKDTEGRTRP